MKYFFSKQKRLLLSILVLICVLGVGTTVAYIFATDGTLTNSFKYADLDTGIVDTGTGVDKAVSVKNKGESPAWVRVRLMVSGIDPAKVRIVTSEDEKPENEEILLVMENQEVWGIGSSTSYKNLMSEQGWIYYQDKLQPNVTTPELLSGVVFGDNVDPNTITITVSHESVLAMSDDHTTDFENPKG